MTNKLPRFGFGDVLPEVPAPAPSGELAIELVPATSWGANLRSALHKRDWDTLRKRVYRLAGFRCEVCGGKGRKHPVECHEVWDYDDETHVQKLIRLIALCPACHEVKHFGRAERVGRGDRAFLHLMQVNGWEAERADRHLREAYAVWDRRSHHEWTLDLSWLDEFGIVPYGPDEAGMNQDPGWED